MRKGWLLMIVSGIKHSQSIHPQLTLFGFGHRETPRGQVGLFEGPPFEVFLVSATLDLAFMTLVTRWFNLITLQPFRLAGDAAFR